MSEADKVSEEALADAFAQALKEMSFEEMLCLWLILYCDQSHAFVAEMLDEPPRNVSRWYRRALRRIRLRLLEKDEKAL